MLPKAGTSRAVIEAVRPEIDGGQFPIKRVIGERVVVEADIYADGHDVISCVLLYTKNGDRRSSEAPMEFIINDRWRGEFTVTDLGTYTYTVQAWVDHFKSWHRDLNKRVSAGQDVSVDLLIGANLIDDASKRARGNTIKRLKTVAQTLRDPGPLADKIRLVFDPELYTLMTSHPDRTNATTYDRKLTVLVNRERARFSAWYEMFPRSTAEEPGKHGTFKDCENRLAYVAGMGFDVLYLPPIHPIGVAFRKGKNNAVVAQDDDVGSPWAIGAKEGGHKAIHPDLGTLADFRSLVKRARAYGLDMALDIAFQCSPDHPWVKQHPNWFVQRPDGTIQYAENPPKKYQDIYPINFETDDWKALWEELRSVFLYWIEQGVHIFRVDNPHTKSFYFWEWCIQTIHENHPDIIFLSEAFTRPKVMYRLAKLGFTQSYTYFAWRNEKWNLTEYFTELTKTDVREFFRPNPWPNTPDILNEYLQTGGRPAFKIRLILAATLAASYGIYGPTFELGENTPREPGSEEYLDSEKYQLRHWNLERHDSLKDLITLVNRIRRENVALQSDWSLLFHNCDNEKIIAYSKQTEDDSNRILVVVNLDPFYTQSGWIGVPLDTFDIEPQQPYPVHDLLTGITYTWQGSWNYVELNAHGMPAHIFRI